MLGREQKREMKGEGEWREGKVSFLFPRATPSILHIFCSRSNFSAINRSETLAMQPKENVLASLRYFLRGFSQIPVSFLP